MKILKIMVSGFKLLKDNFEINLLNKGSILTDDIDYECLQLNDSIYFPSVSILTGKNSSGKTTLISLFNLIEQLIETGRVLYNPYMFSNDKINLSFHIFYEDKIYKYVGEILKPSNLLNDNYCVFSNEKLYSAQIVKRSKNNIDNLNYLEIDSKSSIKDTSILYNQFNKLQLTIDLNTITESKTYLNLFFELSKRKEFDNVIKCIYPIFDNSIEYITKESNENYHIKIINEEEKIVSFNYLLNVLSRGTIKGLFLFTYAMYQLALGGVVIIDEIENSFSKNLVENLIFLFQDPIVNKKKANLIFSTHYLELVDLLNRNDSIYILQKGNKGIDCHNLYTNYGTRKALLKSKQFFNNTFDTLVNYEYLMNLKKALAESM